MAIGFMHFVVLVYFVLAMLVLYGKAVKSVTGQEWSRLARYEEILVITSPAAIISALLGFLATKLVGFITPVIAIIIFCLIGLFLILRTKRTRYLSFLWVIPVLFMPYLLAMSLIWCRVNVTTNQTHYKIGESAIITIKSEGYLFSPQINKIELSTDSGKEHLILEELKHELCPLRSADHHRYGNQAAVDRSQLHRSHIHPASLVVFAPRVCRYCYRPVKTGAQCENYKAVRTIGKA